MATGIVGVLLVVTSLGAFGTASVPDSIVGATSAATGGRQKVTISVNCPSGSDKIRMKSSAVQVFDSDGNEVTPTPGHSISPTADGTSWREDYTITFTMALPQGSTVRIKEVETQQSPCGENPTLGFNWAQ